MDYSDEEEFEMDFPRRMGFRRGGRLGRGRGRGRGGYGHPVPIENRELRHSGVEMAEDDSMLLEYVPDHLGDPGSVQYLTHGISPSFKYFELEIVSWGESGRIGLGLARRDYPMGNMPGWRSQSIGYHADDGRLFHANGHGQQFGPVCAVGDRMGCGVELLNGDNMPAKDNESEGDEDDDDCVALGGRHMNVYFTRNGERVGSLTRVRSPEGGFFPVVAMHSEGESIRVFLDVGSANPSAREVHMKVLKAVVEPDVPVWNRLNNVEQVGNRLRYTSWQNSGLAQCKLPMTLRWPYFELEIVDNGENCYIAIGVAHSKYPFGQHPGWQKNSVAYHADDGKLFNGCGQGEAFGPSCRKGDRMGCGIYFRPRDKGIMGDWDPPSSSEEDDDDDDDHCGDDLDSSSSSSGDDLDDRRVYVYFTRNGKKIGGCASVVPAGGYFPTIGLMSRGEVVETHVRACSG